jgi:LmbE family N-acetylglucosaminyl deacetylase
VPALSGRVVVVSPHLDDAVLSLGGTLAHATQAGADVRVVTVFAGDPSSEDDSAPWDRGCGFRTAGEAARARRQEDRRACAALRCTPHWLPFSSVQYQSGRDERDVWAELKPELVDAETILLPGFPLTHPDHLWLSRLVTSRQGRDPRLGYFVEQPYAGKAQPQQTTAASVEERFMTWTAPPLRLADRHARGRACRAYRSQFRGRTHLPRRLLLPELFTVNELLCRAAQ